MNKKMVKGLVATTLVGGMVVGMTPAASAANNLDTDTTIGFKSDTHVPPVTPPGPNSLALLWAPEKFDFAQDHVAGSAGAAIAQKSDVNLASAESFVTVRDTRTTAASGEWKLTMKASQLKTSDATPKTLTNATYALVNKSAIEYLGSASPELAASKGSADAAITTSAVASLAADGTTEATIASAATSAEKAWSIQVDDLTLNVPIGDVNAAAAGERYDGTITWTLSDTI